MPSRSLSAIVLGAALVAALVAPRRAESAEPAPAPAYRACPGDRVWSDAASGCVCAGALRWDPATKTCTAACPQGKVQVAGAAPGTCAPLPRTCPPGQHWSELHDGCVPACPAGKAPNAAGTGCVADTHGCPADTQWFERVGASNQKGACLPFCVPGFSIDYATKTCVADASLSSATPPSSPPPPRLRASQRPAPPPRPAPVPAPPPPEPEPVAVSEDAETPTSSQDDAIVAAAPPPAPPPPPPSPRASAQKSAAKTPKRGPASCPPGKEWNATFELCVPVCNDGEVLDFYGIGCHPIRARRR